MEYQLCIMNEAVEMIRNYFQMNLSFEKCKIYQKLDNTDHLIDNYIKLPSHINIPKFPN